MKKIAIHSVPRSGSTWLGQIFNSNPSVKYAYQPLFSYQFKSYLDDFSNKETINHFFDEIRATEDAFINQYEEIENNLIPKFLKNKNIEAIVYKEVRYHYILENMLQESDDVIVIGLIRNPLSVINSWLKAPREFRKDLLWNELEEWDLAEKKNQNKREEYNGFQKWKEVTVLFENLQNKYPNRFMLVVYDDLIRNVNETVIKIFDFCELEMSSQTLSFINNKTSDNSHAYSVFKQINQDVKWKSQLNAKIRNEIIEELKNSSHSKYLIDLD